jgi:drug/metabolite transporter (DMT)-like permease
MHSAVLSVVYGILSIAMVFTNKSLLSGIRGNSDLGSYLILIVQCAVAWMFVGLGGLLTSTFSLAISWSDFGFICLVNVAFIGTILANVNTLRYLSVHMVTLLKNTSIIFTALGDWFFLRSHLSGLVWVSLFLIMMGSSCGVLTDLEFSLIGLGWMVISCGSSSGYVLLCKVLLSGRSIHFFTVLFWNNLLSSAFLGVWVMLRFRDPLKDMLIYRNTSFQVNIPFLVFSGFLGLLLNLSTFSLLGSTSATSYVVVGAAKKIVQVLLSFIFFRKSASFRNGIAVCIGLTGATLYAYLKWKETNSNIPVALTTSA